MTQERIEELRGVLWRESLKYEPRGIQTPGYLSAGLELVQEVDRLRAIISERVSA